MFTVVAHFTGENMKIGRQNTIEVDHVYKILVQRANTKTTLFPKWSDKYLAIVNCRNVQREIQAQQLIIAFIAHIYVHR